MMKQYNFDEQIDRSGTSAYKLELLDKIFGSTNVIPLWVADMDFKTPDFILQNIKNRCDSGVLGYTVQTCNYTNAIVKWLQNKHDWAVHPSHIGFVPGVVTGLAIAINTFTQKGDKVLVQTPVYAPFLSLPVGNDRELIINPLKIIDNKMEIDFVDFEQKLALGVRLFILCNPHNPGGRMWSRKDLIKIAELCFQYNVLVISDEIHADMALWGGKHIPFAMVSPQAADNVITLMAPSKTFNIPGLASSFYIAKNPSLRAKFQNSLDKLHLNSGNVFAYFSTEIAYQNGKNWLEQMLHYVEQNILFVDDFIKRNIPQIKVMIPEASFLVFLDCRNLGLPLENIKDFMVTKAHLAMNDGASFGKGGEGFQRLNVACSQAVLEKAMNQLKEAIDELKNKSKSI